MKNLVIGILAHVDSGKTTLSEAALYKSGEIKKLGRVDHGDSFLDSNELERNRGITIFSKQALLSLKDTEVTLLDTPGHVDFSAEMERTLQVMDYAILVISGSSGVQAHTETLWKLLAKHQIPVFVFVNKMDLVWKKKDQLIDEMKERLGDGFVNFSTNLSEKEFFENIALQDEKILETFLETESVSEEEIIKSVQERKVFPCYFGSALKVLGIEEFLDGIDKYTKAPEKSQKFGAKIFKIAHDNQGNRLTYMKITSGSLMVKDNINGLSEKVNQLRIYSGNKFQAVDSVGQGRICAAIGLTKSFPGQGLGVENDTTGTNLEPVLTYKINLPEGEDPHILFGKLKELEEEEPKLYISWNDDLGEIHVKLMGEMQLEILKSMIKERFGVEVSFGHGNIVYKETILNKVEGVGHFEPLRHYAEVHLILEGAEQGSGLCFDTACSEDVLGRNWQNLILTHLEEKPHLGVLTGSPITDMKITLGTGKAHKKHTEGGDFRQATYRAVRNGLMQAESRLLEPWYDFTIEVPTENVGRVMSDVKKMGGRLCPPQLTGDFSSIKGAAPVAEMQDYQSELNGYSKGRGRMSCSLAGYEPCHNEGQVIERIGYDPLTDPYNTGDSVFCTGGAGVNVKWDQVFSHMDLESVLKETGTKGLDNEFLAKRAESYGELLVSDKELMAIFEKTYGPVKRKNVKGSRVVRANADSTYVSKEKKPQDFSGPEYILVDGYNVIHDWEELESLSKVDFGSARERLIEILCNYCGFMQCEMIVVFDAYKVKGNVGSVEKINGISVVYTKEAETADMYIEKVTHKIGRKHKVRVVTSDGLEQLIIMGHGALRISARGFHEEVLEVEKAISEYLEVR